MTSKRKRIFSGITATVMAISILTAGTFAWQSISQKALNEVKGSSNAGGRLHDDFNGSNKDVYVENFTDPKNGQPIYARIRLREYMEYGEDAGKGAELKPENPTPDKTGVTIVKNPDENTPRINDKSTWTIHKLDQTVTQDGQQKHEHRHEIHKYWEWKQGGQTKYMPTFNKDNNSLDSDRNGTFEGADGNRYTDEDRYSDYVDYSDPRNSQKTDNAIYQHATEKNPEAIIKQETHTVKDTPNATILTMQQWKDMGSPVGDYWVYDTDGWAYYAKAIMPGKASGLILDEIIPTNEIKKLDLQGTEWYYAIEAEAEFATKGDWGKVDPDGNGPELGTGFYKNGIEKDGLDLLNQISGNVTFNDQGSAVGQVDKVEVVTANGPVTGVFDLPAGQGQTFTARVGTLKTSERAVVDTSVDWVISPKVNSPVFTYGSTQATFNPTRDMIGEKYTITAVSKADRSKKLSIVVRVTN